MIKLFAFFLLSYSQCISAQNVTFLGKKKKVKKVIKVSSDTVSTRSSALKKEINQLKSHNKKLIKKNEVLTNIAMTRIDSMDFWESGLKIRIGDSIGGVLDLSVLSTNLGSPVSISVFHDSLPDGSKVLCTGTTKHKRVMASCHTLVTPYDEYEIEATILDADGSHGMLGRLSTGKEKYIAGIFASEMAKGAFAVAQDRISTPNGEQTIANSKNMVLQGMMNTGNAASEIMKEQMTTEEPKVFVRRGKSVIVYFLKTLKRSEDS